MIDSAAAPFLPWLALSSLAFLSLLFFSQLWYVIQGRIYWQQPSVGSLLPSCAFFVPRHHSHLEMCRIESYSSSSSSASSSSSKSFATVQGGLVGFGIALSPCWSNVPWHGMTWQSIERRLLESLYWASGPRKVRCVLTILLLFGLLVAVSIVCLCSLLCCAWRELCG